MIQRGFVTTDYVLIHSYRLGQGATRGCPVAQLKRETRGRFADEEVK